MWTVEQNQEKETYIFPSILFNCGHFGSMSMNSDGLECTVARASCSLLKLTKNTVSEFSLVLLQTTEPDRLNSAIQGLCQCA